MKCDSLMLGLGLFIILVMAGCGTTNKAVGNTNEASSETSQITESPVIEAPSIANAPVEQRGPGNQGNGEAFQVMVESLKLSPDQSAQFQIINIYYREKMAKLREEARASGEGFQSMREVFQKLREEQNAALQNLLTEAQYKVYNDFILKQRAERGNRQG